MVSNSGQTPACEDQIMPNIKKLLVCQMSVTKPNFLLKNCLSRLTGVYHFIKLFTQYTSYEAINIGSEVPYHG